MRFTGMMRVRNAGDLLRDSLDHMAQFCDEVFVFDDASTDDTVDVATAHPVVREVLRATKWDPDQQHVQSVQRHVLFQYARSLGKNRWCLYLDADERLELDPELARQLTPDVNGLAFRLFDFYLTPDDHAPYRRGAPLATSRRWCGPEYRDIIMAFDREKATFPPTEGCVREPIVEGKTMLIGYAKHYGKAISVADWERKCDHYARHVPRYAAKWEARRGQAIHTRSDFGAELVPWESRNRGAVPVPV